MTNRYYANVDKRRVSSYRIRGYIAIQTTRVNLMVFALGSIAYVINPSVTSSLGRDFISRPERASPNSHPAFGWGRRVLLLAWPTAMWDYPTCLGIVYGHERRPLSSRDQHVLLCIEHVADHLNVHMHRFSHIVDMYASHILIQVSLSLLRDNP